MSKVKEGTHRRSRKLDVIKLQNLHIKKNMKRI